jgi:hypothetical protein
VTYSPDHAEDGRRMTEFLNALDRASADVRQLVLAYGDAVTMPGRRPDVDADGTGRQATHRPSRPTECTALDPGRTALQAELKTGALWLPYAVAAVQGVAASMDRALARWEGEDVPAFPGGLVDHRNGAADH